MANEITTNLTLSVAKGNVTLKSLAQNKQFTLSGTNYVLRSASAPTTAGGTAIDVAGLATPLGWIAIKNNDSTNYMQLMTAVTGSGGVVFGKLYPGEMAVFRFDDSITAPAVIGHTAAVAYEYLVLEN